MSQCGKNASDVPNALKKPPEQSAARQRLREIPLSLPSFIQEGKESGRKELLLLGAQLSASVCAVFCITSYNNTSILIRLLARTACLSFFHCRLSTGKSNSSSSWPALRNRWMRSPSHRTLHYTWSITKRAKFTQTAGHR